MHQPAGTGMVVSWYNTGELSTRVGLRFTAVKEVKLMSEILAQFVNEFYAFTLAALGMYLAYLSKKNDRQDKEK